MSELWIEKAYNLMHQHILKYTKGTSIPPEWVAGLVYVECGRLDPKAKRFESHVYKSVDFVKRGGQSKAFPGFNSGNIKAFIQRTSSESELKSLATSYGLGQLMGYHYVNKWGLKPAQYMNLTVEESIKYTVLFMLDGMKFIKKDAKRGTRILPAYEQLMRWHNTGSTTGKTYHDNYVTNATNIATRYASYMKTKETK